MATATEKGTSGSDVGKARARALALLVVALIAALGVAAILTRYLDRRIAAVRVPTKKVVVAASDLRVATTLQPELLAEIEWPVASLPDGTFGAANDVAGKIVNTAISKGEPILRSKITSGEGKGALSVVLPAGMRAVAVRVDDVVGVAGFIHPGDRVDVIVTMRPTDRGDAPFTSKIILQNIKVLTVGKDVDTAPGRDPAKPLSATVATLMVNSDQAEQLALAAAKGQLLLALRSAVDAELVETSGAAPQILFGWKPPPPPAPAEPERKRKTRPTLARVRQEQAPPREGKVVEILRGDRPSRQPHDSACDVVVVLPK